MADNNLVAGVAYEAIPGSGPKPYQTSTVLGTFLALGLLVAGIICAVYFTIGESKTSDQTYSLLEDIGASNDACNIIAANQDLHCWFHADEQLWLCLDHPDESYQFSMELIESFNPLSAEFDEQQSAVVCAHVSSIGEWVCHFPLADPTYSSGLICAKTGADSDWLCIQTDETPVLADIATLYNSVTASSVTQGLYQQDHKVGCVIVEKEENLAWECGSLFDCVYQSSAGWFCWGGNATSASSSPWFSDSRDKLLEAQLTTTTSSSAGNDVTAVDQICYYHPTEGLYKCAQADSDIALQQQEVTDFNRTLSATYQCTYVAAQSQWLCLRDERVLSFAAVSAFQSCVNQAAAVSIVAFENATTTTVQIDTGAVDDGDTRRQLRWGERRLESPSQRQSQPQSAGPALSAAAAAAVGTPTGEAGGTGGGGTGGVGGGTNSAGGVGTGIDFSAGAAGGGTGGAAGTGIGAGGSVQSAPVGTNPNPTTPAAAPAPEGEAVAPGASSSSGTISNNDKDLYAVECASLSTGWACASVPLDTLLI
mmetsp:Transcript_22792/g.38032  ORF Transcript_22792/g.38032 Transcript_22792/m.38032 type:complete len:537 (-) Transcript_22792:883-2493(-)